MKVIQNASTKKKYLRFLVLLVIIVIAWWQMRVFGYMMATIVSLIALWVSYLFFKNSDKPNQ